MTAPAFIEVEDAAARLREGEFLVLCEREDDEAIGCLVVAAEFADTAAVNFMVREARGLVCLALTDRRCEELGLAKMARGRQERVAAFPFTVTIEAATGVTTGISAADRARTIAVAIDPGAGPRDLVVPGHVAPLRAAPGGVLERPFLTEAAVELAVLAGSTPAAAICQILAEDGDSARLRDLREVADRHHLGLVSVTSLIAQSLRGGGSAAPESHVTPIAGGPR